MVVTPTTAPILGTTADGSASAESARGLLLTVLGELALPVGGSAWTQTLVALLAGLDIKDKAARQALSRMERTGWLERQRQGRSVRWILGQELRQQLASGGTRIYTFGQRRRRWNGSWLLVLPGERPAERSTEFQLARALRWAGCGPASRGTWICPWTDHRQTLADVLEAHGAGADGGARLFEAKLADMGTDTGLVSGAWDIKALGRQYELFLTRFERPEGRHGSSLAAATELVDLVHQWRKFPLIDPELPAELLPDNWSGHRAAELFARRRSVLLAPAQQWWTESGG